MKRVFGINENQRVVSLYQGALDLFLGVFCATYTFIKFK